MQDVRTDILGSITVGHDDAKWTMIVYFRSEKEAREGERKEMPAEIRQTWENEMAQMQDVTYLDLRHPWFASKE